MGVYYCASAAVVINYVNKSKSNNRSQTRSEQNMQNLCWFIITHFCILLLLHGWKDWGKTKILVGQKLLDVIGMWWRRACLFSAEGAVKMPLLLAAPVHPPVYSGHCSELWLILTLNTSNQDKLYTGSTKLINWFLSASISNLSLWFKHVALGWRFGGGFCLFFFRMLT